MSSSERYLRCVLAASAISAFAPNFCSAVDLEQASSDVIFHNEFEPPPPPPPNDTCANAALLVIGTPVAGTTSSAAADYDSGPETCTGFSQAGADVAYQIVLSASTKYTVTLGNLDSWFDASISLVGPGSASVCNAVPLNCLAGADAGAFGQGETFQFTPSANGTYYIIVDSFYNDPNSGGNFTLEVTQ